MDELRILIICGWAAMLWWGISLDRYREKEWSGNSLKHYDCFVVFAGIPFLVICFILFLIKYF